MKYTIKITAHTTLAIQLLRLNNDDLDDLVSVMDLNSVYFDWVERKEENFVLN